MSNDVKVFLGIIGGTLLLIFAAAFMLGNKTSTPPPSFVVDEKFLIRPESWRTGSDSAKVTVIEFSDFQCPSCKAAQPVIETVIAKYGNNLRFIYREFPLEVHEFGFLAAQAAEAAGLQGKFWEMHDALFKQSPDLSKDKLLELARNLNLDMAKFNQDFDSDTVRQRVLNDQSDGNRLEVSATPTFFINGSRLVGYADLEKLVSSKVQ